MAGKPGYRPGLEPLERRDAPALIVPVPIDTTISGHFSSVTKATAQVHFGSIRGTATFRFTQPDANGNESGVVIIRTNRGNVIFTDTGNINEKTGQFTQQATLVAGTRHFRGSGGSLTITGSANLLADTFTATVMGTLNIPAK